MRDHISTPTTIAVLCVYTALGAFLYGQAGGGGLGPQPNSGMGLPPGSRGQQSQSPARGKGASPIGALLPSASLPSGVRETQPGSFIIDDTRPLEVASQLLSRKLGVPVSYEGAAWVSPRDIVSASDLPGNQAIASPNQSIPVPKGGIVTLTIPSGKIDNRVAIIQSAIDSHHRNGNPGEFKIVNLGQDEFSIVSSFAADEKGTTVKQNNPLDQRISFVEAERTLDETLNLICRLAGTAAQTNIVRLMGSLPSNRIALGARDEVARDVLAKLLRRHGGQKLMWSLRFDPQSKIYGIVLRGM